MAEYEERFRELAKVIDQKPDLSFKDNLIRIAVEIAYDNGILKESEVEGKNLHERYELLKNKIKG